jgi:DNA-binding CsgD family transcriptional regulator
MSNLSPIPRIPVPHPDHWRQILTPREAATLALIALGWTNREIGQGHSVSPHTVKELSTRIYSKTNTRNRVEAARWWWVNIEAPCKEFDD